MNEQTLSNIEAIISEIERLDRPEFRQASDREAFNIASRIERKMRKNQNKPQVKS